MVFYATGDEFCCRIDATLLDVAKCVKLVDKFLLYDEDLLEHHHHANTVLKNVEPMG